ncbi:MAG TPA: hypothetical protein PLV45_09315 [bacterium]|nr:hypothetical protein [bacterium]
MRRLVILILGIAFCLSLTWTGFAEEMAKSEQKAVGQLEQKWIDITEKVLANPADKGGWTPDEKGKIYRSDDGNWIKIEHSSYGVYLVDLASKKVMKMDGDTPVEDKSAQLIQRDFGSSLVIKGEKVKFRLIFTEKVSGMEHIEGIKGM